MFNWQEVAGAEKEAHGHKKLSESSLCCCSASPLSSLHFPAQSMHRQPPLEGTPFSVQSVSGRPSCIVNVSRVTPQIVRLLCLWLMRLTGVLSRIRLSVWGQVNLFLGPPPSPPKWQVAVIAEASWLIYPSFWSLGLFPVQKWVGPLLIHFLKFVQQVSILCRLESN